MVTEVDDACERLIVDGIRAARPDDGILWRGGREHRGDSGVRWVIDPIDGTTNYLYGHPGYGVSIAVEVRRRDRRRRRPRPAPRRRASAAVRGGGATRNGEPIAVSDETDLGAALVATGFGYEPHAARAQAEVLARADRLDPRHPPDGRRRGRPLLGRLRRVDAYSSAASTPGTWPPAADRRRGRATLGDSDGTVIAAPPASTPLRARRGGDRG